MRVADALSRPDLPADTLAALARIAAGDARDLRDEDLRSDAPPRHAERAHLIDLSRRLAFEARNGAGSSER